jgi:hypothetical protein
VGTVAAAAILMTATGRCAASEHHLDEISLNGVFAEGLKLTEQFYYRLRRYTPSRVMEIKSHVK